MPRVVIATFINTNSPKEVSCTFKLLLKDAEITKEQINDIRTKTCSREKIIHFEVIFVKGLKYLDIGVQSFE
jgi:hypothetical protein